MRIRAVDGNNDWLFGKGQNDYKRGLEGCKQNIKTRVQEHLGDCFFNTFAGIDWFGFLGGKDTTGLKLGISAVILNTEDVTGINTTEARLTESRVFDVSFSVQTAYGTAAEQFVFDPTVI